MVLGVPGSAVLGLTGFVPSTVFLAKRTLKAGRDVDGWRDMAQGLGEQVLGSEGMFVSNPGSSAAAHK